MSELFNSYIPYLNRVGKKYKILITEESSDKKHFVGHNKCYEQILVPKEECRLGTTIEVEVVSFGKYYMIGKPVSKSWLSSVSHWKNSLLESHQMLGRVWLTSCVIVLGSSLLYKAYRHISH